MNQGKNPETPAQAERAAAQARIDLALNVGKVQQCEDCGEVYTITRRYDFCRNCFCPECGGEIGTKGYCAPCSQAADRFEEMAYGRDF